MPPKSSNWLWLFPIAYFLHAIEEIKGLGAFHGINLSSKQFLVFSGVALLLLVCGIILARRYGFPQLLSVCLGTAVLLNGLSHIAESVSIAGYDAGVITGTVIFIPIGLVTLFGLMKSMARLRYAVGIALGVLIQGIAMILAR